MSDVTPGPARRLVEEMERAMFLSDGSYWNVRAAADAHDAAHAALVQAAEAFFGWFDSVDGTTAQGVQARNQLRAALKAVQKEGDNG